MDLSIIIPTRNHPHRLTSCLASILEGDSGSWAFEVLVMDNSDAEFRQANEAVVASLGDDRVRYVPMADVGLMAARHQGVESSTGAIVSFIDDDELLLPAWFAGVQSCLQDRQVALATGPFIPRYEAKPPSWFEYLWDDDASGRHLLSLTLFDGGDHERDIDPIWVLGGNLTIRRAVFQEVRGSHPDYIPPPWEAFQGDGETGLTVKVRAAGFRARYSPDAAVLHAVPAERMALDYLVRRAWFNGLAASFAATRRENGLGADHGVPDSTVVSSRSLPVRIAGAAAGRLRTAVRASSAAPSLISGPWSVARDVRRQTAEAHRDGFEWHQSKVAERPGLREYVCRPDFLGANGQLPVETVASL
jgi:glycosyltransferase involved in cell wall biosynthesis